MRMKKRTISKERVYEILLERIKAAIQEDRAYSFETTIRDIRSEFGIDIDLAEWVLDRLCAQGRLQDKTLRWFPHKEDFRRSGIRSDFDKRISSVCFVIRTKSKPTYTGEGLTRPACHVLGLIPAWDEKPMEKRPKFNKRLGYRR